MFIDIPKDGYHLTANGLKSICEKYEAQYMGPWCTKRSDGSWNEKPVDVFYQEKPDREQGHSNYFGIFVEKRDSQYGRHVYITDAATAFSEPMTGAVCDDGEVIVSRYRHDYIEKKGAMIDGGRDYVRTTGSKSVTVSVDGPNFVIDELN